MDRALASLLAAQCPSGAFASEVSDFGTDEDRRADENAFTTAQVALLLLDCRAAGTSGLDGAIEAALNFIESCESTEKPGAFCFYPDDRAALPGRRLDVDLPPDLDDTSLAWAALLRGGRRTDAQARAALLQYAVPLGPACRRLHDPAWADAGALRTWLADVPDNRIDVCVNVNVVMAFQLCGLNEHPVVHGIQRLLNAALSMTGNLAPFRRLLTPYYAHGAELAIALGRAFTAGAQALRVHAQSLAAWDHEDRRAARPNRPLYCDLSGRPVWRSSALQLARRCADQLIPPSFPLA